MNSDANSSKSSNSSSKSKKLLRASERKASKKLGDNSPDSDSDDESVAEAAAVSKAKTFKKQKNMNKSAEEATWRDEFDDGLGEDFIGDEEDRDKLENMTEKEREEEIFKRAEKREELKKRFEISQKLKSQLKNKETFKDKSDGELSSDGESQKEMDTESRKKGYEVKHAAKFSALSQLKAKREEKEKKDKERKAQEERSRKKKRMNSESDSDMEKLAKSGRKNKKMKASEIYSSDSDSAKEERRRSDTSSSSSSSSSSGSSGESDTERHKSKKVVKKALNVACKEDLEKIRLSRYKIDKFVHLPIFKQTVIGCFVRIGIGNNPEKNIPIYRVAEIIDVCETAKVYDVMQKGNRTNLGFRLNFGKSSKVFRAQFISNQPFTDSEFNKWKETCVSEHVDLPTFKHVDAKITNIQTALTYRFSSNDVDKILASKEKFAKGPKNYAMAKAKMMKEKANAQTEGNTELVEKMDLKLAELEERAEQLDKARCGSLSNISFINDRNRKSNVERAERGIREEEKRIKLEGRVDDPFTRRKTRPVLSMPKKDDDAGMTSELLIKLEQERRLKEEQLKASAQEEKENIEEKKIKDSEEVSDIFSVHDFDVDINIQHDSVSDLGLSSISVKPVSASQPVGSAPSKRKLKLEDYKKRRGIL